MGPKRRLFNESVVLGLNLAFLENWLDSRDLKAGPENSAVDQRMLITNVPYIWDEEHS